MPVEITVKLLLAAMEKSETKKFLIDGFPRSLNNYEVGCCRGGRVFSCDDEEQGWYDVVGDDVHVAFCLFFECPEEELERRYKEIHCDLRHWLTWFEGSLRELRVADETTTTSNLSEKGALPSSPCHIRQIDYETGSRFLLKKQCQSSTSSKRKTSSS